MPSTTCVILRARPALGEAELRLTPSAQARLAREANAGSASRRVQNPDAASDCAPLRALQRDLLVGAGIGEAGDQAEPGLAHSRSDAVDEGELPDRCEHRALVHELLHLFEHRRAFLGIQLGA